MIAVDTNILVYAHRGDSPHHTLAKDALTQLAEGEASWAIVWHCIAEFYSIVTHPKIFDPPSTPAQAIAQIEAWLESPALRLLAETDASWPVFKATLEQTALRGPRVYDGRIASLCLEHGVSSLFTADRDFSAFPKLTTHNPLDG